MDPYNTPSMEPPTGMESNLDEPNGVLPGRIAAVTVCFSVSTFAVIMRLYVRKFLLKTFALDDYAIVFTYIGFASWIYIMMTAGRLGDGKHQWNVSLANMTEILYYLNVIELVYSPTMYFMKYAILRQIETFFFSYNNRSIGSRIIRGLIWANLIFYIATFFLFLFVCIPREKIWKPTIEGRCLSDKDLIIATSVINVLSDVAILVTPLAVISRLQMPLKNKLGTGAVFGVGVLATVTTIVRLYYSVILAHRENLTYNLAPVGHWALGEFTAGILVACLPSLPRLLKHLRGDIEQPYNSSRTSPRKSHYQKTPGYFSKATDSCSVKALREDPIQDTVGGDSVALSHLETCVIVTPGVRDTY
ncbi:hypothetical protein F5B19DRAFT_257183 [Rostrohypoxylon terebratum]|nr:hypothetical protein F5B19DRAFT_257183 [Rostrohypoxylon terebratum]